MDLESRVTGIVGRGMRRGILSSELEPEESSEDAAGAEADASWFSVAGCAHGGNRAEARGVEGEGAAMVEHDDGEEFEQSPPLSKPIRKSRANSGA